MTGPRPGAAHDAAHVANGLARDLPSIAAGFGAALHSAGLPVGPDRSERFARAVTIMRPAAIRELYWCGLATLISDPGQIEMYNRVFAAVFGGLVDPAEQRGDPNSGALPGVRTGESRAGSAAVQVNSPADRPGEVAGAAGARAGPGHFERRGTPRHPRLRRPVARRTAAPLPAHA